jgi:DNA-binding IclR family transcriptional regulator
MQILEEMKNDEFSRVSELSHTLEMPESTIYKYLKTLETKNYVQKTEKGYAIGYQFLQFGGSVRDRCRIFQFGREKVETLADETDEVVFISILDGEQGIFIFRANDQYNIKESLPLGKRFHLHENASGKAMLAELSDGEIERIIANQGLPGSTEETISSEEELFAELEQVRSQGYALNQGERDSRLMAVSSAVTDPKNDEIGAIGLSVPCDSPATAKLDDEYARLMQMLSSKLTQQLRHS